MLGRARGVESNGRKARLENQKAVEDGLDEVSGAIQELMKFSEEDRQLRLAQLSEQLKTVTASAEGVDPEERLKRLSATDKLVELLSRISTESSNS